MEDSEEEYVIEEYFTDDQKRGLLGKLIKIMEESNFITIDGIRYAPQDIIKQKLSDLSDKELDLLYKKIMECEKPKKFIERIPMRMIHKPARIERIVEYLSKWRFIRRYYELYVFEEGFLCGFFKNILQSRAKTISQAYDVIENKTNTDALNEIKKFLGGKRTRKNKKRLSHKKNKRRTRSKKNVIKHRN